MRQRDIIPQGIRFDVFRRDNFTCVYCGRSSPDVTLECDHRIAHSKGGSDDKDNLVTACHDCNRGKSAKDAPARPTPGAKSTNGLAGQFGHSLNGDAAEWQFVIKEATDGFAVLQLFSWLDGRETNIELVPIAQLADREKFRIYASEKEWLRAASESMERARERGRGA